MANWQLKILGLLLLIFIAGCSEPNGSVKSVVITPNVGTVGVNKTQQFYATVYNYSNQVVVKTVTWSVTGGIGTIDSNGKFTAGSSLLGGTIVAQADAASSSITVVVTDKGSLSGVISDDTGAKGADTYVYLNDLPSLATTSDLNGNYSISQVPVGTHEIVTRANMVHLSASKTVTIEAGTNSSLNLVLPMRFTATENIVEAGGVTTVTVTVTNNGSTEAIGVRGTYNFYDADGVRIDGGNPNFGDIPAGGSVVAYFGMTITTYTTYTKVITASSF